ERERGEEPGKRAGTRQPRDAAGDVDGQVASPELDRPRGHDDVGDARVGSHRVRVGSLPSGTAIAPDDAVATTFAPPLRRGAGGRQRDPARGEPEAGPSRGAQRTQARRRRTRRHSTGPRPRGSARPTTSTTATTIPSVLPPLEPPPARPAVVAVVTLAAPRYQ